MSIHVTLNHKTNYTYDRPVRLSPQIVRLRPAPHARTRISSYSLTISPTNYFINWQQDPHGNFLARLVFPEPVSSFSIEVDLTAVLAVHNPFDFFLEPAAEQVPFAYDPDLSAELDPFLSVPPPGPRLAALLSGIDRGPCPTVDMLVALNRDVRDKVRYVIRMEPGVQSAEETLDKGTGSCRDSAWLLVQILRHLGLAARFVSGYLIQLAPDVRSLDGPAGPEHDFTDLHAWAEVYLPGAGWIGLDPTSGLLAGEGHIPLAATPSPAGAAPVSGAVDPCEVTFSHRMSVMRVEESPRVTRPYSDSQWAAIDALGLTVDEALNGDDVRLTMGGEPTFVSIDDMESPEWTTEAMGPAKRGLAHDLICRLRDRFASGGLLTFGQGKWYPGESLPRWAFALYWRGDGKPLWNNPDLVAREDTPDQPDEETARLFGERLTRRLGIEPVFLVAAYEDPLHHIGREQALPVNVDPLDCHLGDPEERARLARAFSHGLDRPVGFVLPIQRWNSRARPGWASSGWISGRWPLRRGRLFLIPGSSPIGFRLPLDSLPPVAADLAAGPIPQDPFEPRGPLPFPPPLRRVATAPSAGARPSAPPGITGQAPAVPARVRDSGDGPVSDTVRTALALEPRDGRLCVFMPPLETADDFVDLVAAIEDTAEDLAVPVHIEGYPPPPDHRLNVIRVTPDPGVIEVNIHPSATWSGLRDTTLALYECAREARLGAEKFMMDGRHTGTGGGNHIVVGGPTAPDSPFLRRPDLLASLLRYWQTHPGLSYLFSGLFIGPTSQAPRIDEARLDSLYELEIALDLVNPPGTEVPPWLVDRIFRNLLTDVTGNTHRTEICIDKLYSPDGPAGRLGLVEFRAFEMPPHPRMSCVQQLLLRALIARFWRAPCTTPLIRWGNALHDRFMLPHFIWKDLQEVLDDLRDAGFAFQDDWFRPHFEFRFPKLGEISLSGLTLELRQALEPWHVMGEEPGAGGTARYVDSSVERLQVMVSGLTPDRHVVTCNGRRLPLVPDGRPGEFVAGVRYRAWQPPSCLHPTIGVHTPLVFDILDSWNRRSIGGCTYHVAHPGGRAYDTFPVNANEAESRRLSRFFDIGHTPGTIETPPATSNPEFPATLDLRWRARP